MSNGFFIFHGSGLRLHHRPHFFDVYHLGVSCHGQPELGKLLCGKGERDDGTLGNGDITR